MDILSEREKPPLTPPKEGNKKVELKNMFNKINKSVALTPSPSERAGERPEN
jgi:hypothetical protein